MQSMICFVSDFGLDDTWVGVCHAVIHRACPRAQVVDLAHNIPPFDIRIGAARAAAGVHQVPDAIHLIVIDPGVGPGRRDICITTKGGAFLVGPDNGVLLPAARRAGGATAAYEIDPTKVDFRSPLATFHARDILAPVAAALACGVEITSLGRLIDLDDLAPAPFGECRVDGDAVACEVLDSDRFGSLRFNVPSEGLESLGLKAPRVEITMGHTRLEVPFATTFSDVSEGEPVVLVDSSGWLTLALNSESAEERFGVEPGASVRLRALR